MSLSDLSSLGSFIGGIAVVASVIYLALQIRPNTRSVRAQNAIAHFEMHAKVNELAGDPSCQTANSKGSRGAADITEAEFMQYAYLQRTNMTAMQTDWLLHREGLLDRRLFPGYRELLASLILTNPGMRAWWKNYGFQFQPEFKAEIDRIIAETRPAFNDLGFANWKRHVAEEVAMIATSDAKHGNEVAS